MARGHDASRFPKDRGVSPAPSHRGGSVTGMHGAVFHVPGLALRREVASLRINMGDGGLVYYSPRLRMTCDACGDTSPRKLTEYSPGHWRCKAAKACAARVDDLRGR